MPEAPSDVQERHERPFADFLVVNDRGRTHAELTEKLASLVRAVQVTGKGGSLTLTLAVKPLSKGATEQLAVSATVSAKEPQLERAVSIFFPDEDGNLHRDDPQQLAIDGLHVVEKPAPRVVETPARKVVSQ